MGVYDNQIETAKRLIAKFGAVATWSKPVDIIPDPNEPWKTETQSTLTYNPTIAIFPFEKSVSHIIKYLKGSEVPAGSMWGLMPNVNFEPKLKDSVTIGSKNYTLLSIDILAPNGGDAILYILEFST